jgi:hypothetical protein
VTTPPPDVPLSPDALDGGLPATTDALQSVLARHRRRQSRVLAGILVPLLAGGIVGGFLVGRSGTKATTLSSASQPTTPHAASTPPAASGPMIAASGGGSASSGSAMDAGPSTPATQLLLRNALDGTRVRLYSEAFPPMPKCPPTAACATPPVSACFPTHIVTAEVSDDQVAGEAGAPEFNAPTDALDLITATVVGGNQPQPILVAIAHTSSAVTSVRLTTQYGTDKETPTSTGWVALALQLPATWTPAANSGTPTATLTATDATGKTLGSSDLSQNDQGKPCAPPPCPTGSPGPPAATKTPPTGSNTPPAGSNAACAPAPCGATPAAGSKTPPTGPVTGGVSSSAGSSSGQAATVAPGGPGGAVTCESTMTVSSAPSTTA